VLPGKAIVVYNGIKVGETGPAMNIRKELGIPGKARIVTFSAAINEKKGADIFVVLGEHILSRRKDVYFLLIGGGSERKWLENYCRSRGLAGNIRFLGPQSHENALRYIRAGDVLVVPSRAEGFGMSALEGAVLKVPVIASRTGALPEILSPRAFPENMPGYLNLLLDSERERERLVRDNLRVAGKYKLEGMLSGTEKVYSMVSGNRRIH
jgi:glycosyltransferase involved in cell wall biosynthesis